MDTFSIIDAYDETKELSSYVERLENYFEANEIGDGDKRKAIFLATVGAKTYQLIRNSPNQHRDEF